MIYRNSGKVSGQPPLNFKNYSGSIQDYLIEGNTSQNGTPSPQASVDVNGCGVRTENLLDESVASDADATHINYNKSVPILLTAGQTYTFSCDTACNGLYIRSAVDDSNLAIANGSATLTYTPQVNVGVYCRIWNSNGIANLKPMLNIGSTTLPYEPFGYKVPINVNSIEYPIYLGQVPTVRSIKKLVLTGHENWIYRKGSPPDVYFIEFIGAHFIDNSALCTHYQNQDSGSFDELSDKHVLVRFAADGSKSFIGFRDSNFPYSADFKSYLASQYAAGNPVTVWHVLAESETGIVNEPLHKIGDYADSISKTQSNLPIPTISGQNTLTIPTTISPSNVSLTLDQKEIGKIYEGGKREVELSRVPPISFNAIGSQLEDYLIEGNTSQNGTPSPEAPVEVIGCGERTGNLFDISTATLGKYINAQGVETDSTAPTPVGALNHTDYIEIQPNTDYTYHYKYGASVVNKIALCWFDASKNLISRNTKDTPYQETEYTLTGTSPANAAFCIINFTGYLPNGSMKLSFNPGSTALPYEPYGYKLPITVNSTEYPIYLGQVETTRRIKKLVLDGTETFYKNSSDANNYLYYFYLPEGSETASERRVFCTHLPSTGSIPITTIGCCAQGAGTFKLIYVNLGAEIMTGNNSVSRVKTYLAAQYAAGTPVTVWYVLATPETGIVNEPLHKIGSYADSISKTQSNLPIPITTGSNTLSIETTVQPSNITINYNKQTEIAEVYGGIGENHPIYYMNRTIEGTSPIMFKGLGKDLRDYTILGNTSQNGTPTPEAPVDVVGCGNIWNHWNGTLVRYYLGKSTLRNEVTHYVNGAMFQIKAAPNVDYTVEQDSSPATSLLRIYRSNNPLVNGEGVNIAFNSVVEWNGTGTPKATINSGSFKYIWVQFGGTWYDSYGASATISLVGDYVIPITVNGTEYPIYLGQVPTTRKIKKLVLDGTENWKLSSTPNQFYIDSVLDAVPQLAPMCTHFKGVSGLSGDNQIVISASQKINIRTTHIQHDLTDWINYLQQQYAAGTPVTVWYVLAEPETGIVNEPLHKIGNYADTITMAQAEVTIPTSDGGNTISFGTSVQPSNMSITGNIKSN